VAASLCGLGESIGLGKLLKAVLDVTVSKGHARTNWSVRPLPHQLIEYAHADVKHLVLLGKTLLGQLEKLGRKDWALELSAKWEDPKLYQSDPSEIAQKLARGGRFDANGYAALMALVQWREQRVRQLNLPRRWVADDHVLVDLAHVRPKDIAHLSSFRGLNKGELKNSGEAILAALRQGSEGSDQPVPQFKKPNLPTEDELQALEVLRCFLGILADRHKIAAKHLMTAAKLLPLLRTNVESPQEWVLQGVLSAEAVELIGDELVAMIQGKRSLLIKNRRVEVMNISTDRQRDSLADA
jgi:ribonuclease D